jgi:hypothetical protein
MSASTLSARKSATPSTPSRYHSSLRHIPTMPRNPQPLTFTAFPTYRQKLLYDVYNSAPCVMSFDPAKMELVPHYWYVTMASTVYRRCIVSTGPSVGVCVCHRWDCASIVKLISTLDQDACVRCWNRSVKNQCSPRQQYT